MSQAHVALRDLAEGENQLELQVGAAALGIAPPDVEFAGELSVTLDIYREGQGLQINGEIAGVADALCSRCASRFPAPFRATVFLIARWSPGGADSGDYGDDESVIYHDGHVLDLSEPIRQLVLLAQPMAPVCREDCRGLCPRCGIDLNEEQCSCEASAPDPRWSVIGDLLRKSGPRTGS